MALVGSGRGGCSSRASGKAMRYSGRFISDARALSFGAYRSCEFLASSGALSCCAEVLRRFVLSRCAFCDVRAVTRWCSYPLSSVNCFLSFTTAPR